MWKYKKSIEKGCQIIGGENANKDQRRKENISKDIRPAIRWAQKLKWDYNINTHFVVPWKLL